MESIIGVESEAIIEWNNEDNHDADFTNELKETDEGINEGWSQNVENRIIIPLIRVTDTVHNGMESQGKVAGNNSSETNAAHAFSKEGQQTDLVVDSPTVESVAQIKCTL